jgi:hypothetical protein
MNSFDQFIRSKRYLLGVTERTAEWYRYSLALLPSEHQIRRSWMTSYVSVRPTHPVPADRLVLHLSY